MGRISRERPKLPNTGVRKPDEPSKKSVRLYLQPSSWTGSVKRNALAKTQRIEENTSYGAHNADCDDCVAWQRKGCPTMCLTASGRGDGAPNSEKQRLCLPLNDESEIEGIARTRPRGDPFQKPGLSGTCLACKHSPSPLPRLGEVAAQRRVRVDRRCNRKRQTLASLANCLRMLCCCRLRRHLCTIKIRAP